MWHYREDHRARSFGTLRRALRCSPPRREPISPLDSGRRLPSTSFRNCCGAWAGPPHLSWAYLSAQVSLFGRYTGECLLMTRRVPRLNSGRPFPPSLSLMYKRFEQQRAAARALHAFRSDFLLKLQGAYRLTKTVRRALRVLASPH